MPEAHWVVALAATALVALAAHAWRRQPERLWAASWSCLAGVGAALVARPMLWEWIAFLGPLFAALQLAGALALTRGTSLPWVVPAGLALSLLRLAQPGHGVELAIGCVVEPAASLAAAAVLVGGPRVPTAISRSRRGVVLLLVAIAAADAATQGWGVPPAPMPPWFWALWIAVSAVGIPLELHLALRRSPDDELRRAEEALHWSREHYRALAESAFDLIAELDGGERLRYVNPRYEEVLGFPRDHFLGRRPADFLVAGYEGKARAFAREAARRGRAAGLVLPVRCRDGSERWLESVARVFVALDGEPRWVLSSRDVTDRIALERIQQRDRRRLQETVEQRTRDLGASEARFRALADHAPELIAEFDQEGRVLFANEAHRDLLGWEPEVLRGKLPEELVHPDDRAGAGERMFLALRDGTTTRSLHRLRHADGSWRWLDFTGRGFRTPEGQARFVCIARDVTDARRLEDERRRFQAHVQDVQRLESLGLLAGGLAHDFNNLLAVIRGNVALLEAEAAPGSGERHRLGRIAAAARQAEGLTDQMLAYAGKSVSELVPLDLAGLVRDTEELLRASVSDTCRLELDVGEAAWVAGDATQLRQVLINLVANASDALGPVGGRVQIAVRNARVGEEELRSAVGTASAGAGPRVVLEVADDGPGMEEALRRRIFEPFFSTKGVRRGLGLSAVLGIAAAHEGVLALDTEPGRGARFRLLLPPCAPRPVQEVPDRETGGQDEASRPLRVLVVDDDPDVREVARELLQRAGLAVQCAGGGREALERLRGGTGEIDVVLLDLCMPDVPGAEVLRALRQERPELPVVVASGYKRDLAEEKVGLGCAGFVQKPFEPDALAAALRQAVRAR